MHTLQPLRLLILGAPGSGKGTQTNKLLKRFSNIQSVSSGDILRCEISAGSMLGQQAASYIGQGKLLPDNLISGVVMGELARRGWLHKKSSWLLDGFPRTVGQAKVLERDLVKNEASVNMVVELRVPQDVILGRIEKRYIHEPSGRVYNLHYNPPKVFGKDDVTGEPLTKRSDDTAEVFKKRLDDYNQTVIPLKEYYSSKGIFHTVHGDSSDIIFPQLAKLVDEHLNSRS
ncbi:adenylate kinase ADK2 Ecym_3518 [Eremothecium cymbalariae DBVPG|uniref:GTP:AMP phosphotransferase, mitochondrial n=1 Tax=Eremothecium cymbalariae (strain CBS 270.75 / DBVPG 7215 / KCTC 17166 / NRRL Y-17582) TaxID=931890 RepID=G8JQL2_ERECY|nr:Hypothetical protein Ecym_3518 [Eremothecium cymbalariae DBVPG\